MELVFLLVVSIYRLFALYFIHLLARLAGNWQTVNFWIENAVFANSQGLCLEVTPDTF